MPNMNIKKKIKEKATLTPLPLAGKAPGAAPAPPLAAGVSIPSVSYFNAIFLVGHSVHATWQL